MTILTWIYTVSAVVTLVGAIWEAWKMGVKKDLENRKQGSPARSFRRKDAVVLGALCLIPGLNTIVALWLVAVHCEPLASRVGEWLAKPLIK